MKAETNETSAAQCKKSAFIHDGIRERGTIPPFTEVAAAVILNPNGEFLLAQRPAGKPYSGYWEFPGGKLLAGEAPLDALKRELKEELNVDVVDVWPWITRDYTYPHARVRLRFFRVVRWKGELHGLEGQALAWQRAGETSVMPMLPANAPVLSSLALPPVYAISNVGQIGIEPFLKRLKGALEHGMRLVQLREKEMEILRGRELLARVMELAGPYAAKVLINSESPLGVAMTKANGLHLTARDLMLLKKRPEVELCAASCHDETELTHAAEMELDFVVLGPVNETPTHSRSVPLGWKKFAALIREYPLPAYAIGGLRVCDLEHSARAGAHGVAMIRGAWDDAG
jgi:8-oxo-dGTP diphosphatase